MKKEFEEIDITEKQTEENALSYEKRWEAVIPKLIKAYPKLTVDDLKHRDGSEHLRWKLIMKKTGLSRPDLIKLINTLEETK